MNNKRRGSQFERVICKKLSLWWSGDRDDIFWRTSNSGGRATVRGKKDKSTIGHCGDVGPTCSEGEHLFKLVTIEIKLGYNSSTIQDLLDGKTSMYGKWMEQAKQSSKLADVPYWMIIVQRKSRKTLILFPSPLVSGIEDLIGTFGCFPYLDFCLDGMNRFTCMSLEDFFKEASPKFLMEKLKNGR